MRDRYLSGPRLAGEIAEGAGRLEEALSFYERTVACKVGDPVDVPDGNLLQIQLALQHLRGRCAAARERRLEQRVRTLTRRIDRASALKPTATVPATGGPADAGRGRVSSRMVGSVDRHLAIQAGWS